MLILKIYHPKTISQLKLISLCNVIYKVIVKIFLNRLRDIISSMISINQSIFVLHCLIFDNILVASEILRNLKRMKHEK